MKRIEAIIVDGVVYDVVQCRKGNACDRCAFYDGGSSYSDCAIFGWQDQCATKRGYYFRKRKEMKDEHKKVSTKAPKDMGSDNDYSNDFYHSNSISVK